MSLLPTTMTAVEINRFRGITAITQKSVYFMKWFSWKSRFRKSRDRSGCSGKPFKMAPDTYYRIPITYQPIRYRHFSSSRPPVARASRKFSAVRSRVSSVFPRVVFRKVFNRVASRTSYWSQSSTTQSAVTPRYGIIMYNFDIFKCILLYLIITGHGRNGLISYYYNNA